MSLARVVLQNICKEVMQLPDLSPLTDHSQKNCNTGSATIKIRHNMGDYSWLEKKQG